MFDLSYVQDPDRYDKYVSDNADLLELDESFKESYLEIIQRFYTLFEGIFNYYSNLQSYLVDIKDGKYIEFTWDAILQDKDGKRNMVECVYHYGAMLLLLDRLIPSLARERIVTCYLRYMGSSASPLHSKVTKLIKATGYFLNKSTSSRHRLSFLLSCGNQWMVRAYKELPCKRKLPFLGACPV